MNLATFPIPYSRIRNPFSCRINQKDLVGILQNGPSVDRIVKIREHTPHLSKLSITDAVISTESEVIWELLVRLLGKMEEYLIAGGPDEEVQKEASKLLHRAFQYIYNSMSGSDRDFLYFILATDLEHLACKWEDTKYLHHFPVLQSVIRVTRETNRTRCLLYAMDPNPMYDMDPLYEHDGWVGAGPQLMAYEKWGRLLNLADDLDLVNLTICSIRCIYLAINILCAQLLHMKAHYVSEEGVEIDLIGMKQSLEAMLKEHCVSRPREILVLHMDAVQQLMDYTKNLNDHVIQMVQGHYLMMKQGRVDHRIPVVVDLMERIKEFQHLYQTLQDRFPNMVGKEQ